MVLNGIKDNKIKEILDSDEEITYTYLCNSRFICFWKIILAIILILLSVKVMNEATVFIKVCAIFFMFLMMVFANQEIHNFMHQGFYVTNKSLITFFGSKFKFDEIWVLSKNSPEYRCVSFYYKKHFYIQDCLCDGSIEFDEFLLHLYEKSNNPYILQFGSKKLKEKSKLNKTNKIKLIQGV